MGRQRLVWHDGVRFTGTDSWGHDVAIDGDPDGTGAKPSDMVPIALAACTAYDLVSILRKQRQDVRSLEAEIDSEQDPDPPWTFRRIHVRYRIAGDVDETKARKAAALSEEKYCSVAATLRASVELRVTVEVVRD